MESRACEPAPLPETQILVVGRTRTSLDRDGEGGMDGPGELADTEWVFCERAGFRHPLGPSSQALIGLVFFIAPNSLRVGAGNCPRTRPVRSSGWKPGHGCHGDFPLPVRRRA